MTIAKGLLAAAISLAGIAAATAANADSTITFILNDVKFDDGTFATGSLVTDDARTSVVSFAVQTSAGTFTSFVSNGVTVDASAFTWTGATATATLSASGVRFQQLNGGMFGRGLNLEFSPTAGGAVNLTGVEGAFVYQRKIVGGQIVSPAVAATPGAVPEPATWAMMLVGFGGMGFTLRRRAKVTTRIRFA